jgi:hypothetical protein
MADTDAGRRGEGCQPYRRDSSSAQVWAFMKKRLLIPGIVLAALLLALYGVIFGTGAK